MQHAELGSNGVKLTDLDERVSEFSRKGDDDGPRWSALGRRSSHGDGVAALQGASPELLATLIAEQRRITADLAEAQVAVQLAVAQLVEGQAALQRQLAALTASADPLEAISSLRAELADSLYALHGNLSDLCKPLISALDEVSEDRGGSLADRVGVLESRLMAIEARTDRVDG